MKKFLLLVLLIPLLAGCWIYGDGKTNGYITTIENAIVWDVVYLRSELESSQTDGYIINKSNLQLKDSLQEISDKKQRVQIYFKRHLNCAVCQEKVGCDEIVNYKILE